MEQWHILLLNHTLSGTVLRRECKEWCYSCWISSVCPSSLTLHPSTPAQNGEKMPKELPYLLGFYPVAIFNKRWGRGRRGWGIFSQDPWLGYSFGRILTKLQFLSELNRQHHPRVPVIIMPAAHPVWLLFTVTKTETLTMSGCFLEILLALLYIVLSLTNVSVPNTG